ncbi:MAG: carbohydrate ABC transporter permease [Chloroflexi bacterium]|nr:carbohydrate ABC transporter permease [Chloroflexota bacterium]
MGSRSSQLSADLDLAPVQPTLAASAGDVRTRRAVTLDLATYLALTLVGLTMLAPLVWMVATSLKPYEELYLWPPRLLPSAPRWENYPMAWNYAPFGRFFFNSALVATCVTAGELITSSLAGYVFARMRFPGRDRLFLLYLGTLMVPSQVTLVPLYVLMRTLGWVNTYYALIIPALASAYGTFLMRQYMLTLPRELEDAARIDGANHFVIYSRVIVPQCGPVIATLGILTFLGNWNSFLWPLIMTSKEQVRTVPIGLAYFTSIPETVGLPQWQLYLAAATFSMLPTLAVFVLGQRYFVRGITMSGLKG